MIHGQNQSLITTPTNPLLIPALAAATAASASTFLGAPINNLFPQYSPSKIPILFVLTSLPTTTNSELHSVRSAARDQQPAQSPTRGRKSTKDEKENTAMVEKLLGHFFQEDQAKPLRALCKDAALPHCSYQ